MAKPPMGLVELVVALGNDGIRMQNLLKALVNISLRDKGKTSRITFDSESEFLTPNDVMRGPKYVPMLLWLPADKVEEARRAYDAS